MTHKHFVYWLQGYFEISNTKSISRNELACIKKHLYSINTFVKMPINIKFQEFCRWLQMYLKTDNSYEYTINQVTEIRHKLEMLFYHNNMQTI